MYFLYEKGEHMLTKLVSEEHINFMESVEDWKEAIRVAAKPLLDSNRITEKYIEAMIRGVEEFGPYVVIAPMIAMPHARPEFGSIKPGISVLKLKKPISFTSDDENLASVIIVISTKENEAHLEMISELALILSNQQNYQKLINANSASEITEIFHNGMQQC